MDSLPSTPPRPMRGATSLLDGAAGYVPKPVAGDEDKPLHGDGLFKAVTSASAASDAEAAAGTSTTTFTTPANAALAAAKAINPRASRQALAIDASSVPTTCNYPAPGSGDFTFSANTNFPTATGATILSAGNGEGLHVIWGTSGVLLYKLTGGNVTLTATVPTPNVTQNLTVVRLSGVSYAYIDGVLSGSVADTRNYSVNSLAFGGFSYGSGGGTNQAIISGGFYFNYALTSDEVAALYREGAPRAEAFNATPASNTNIQTATFAAHLGGFITGASASGFTADVSSGYGLGSMFSTRKGNRYRVTVTGASITGAPQIWLWDSVAVTDASSRVSLVDGSNTYEYTATRNSDTVGLLIGAGIGTWSGVVSGVTEIPLGLLCAPDANWDGNGPYWPDTSGNGAHLNLPASGVKSLLREVRGASASLINGTDLKSFYAYGAPILTVRVQGGVSHTAGNVLASVDVGTAFGKWVVACSNQSARYYKGGYYAEGGTAYGAAATLEDSLGFAINTQYGGNVGLVIESVSATVTRLKLVAIDTVTAGGTYDAALFLLSGTINPSAIK